MGKKPKRRYSRDSNPPQPCEGCGGSGNIQTYKGWEQCTRCGGSGTEPGTGE